jgi:hypothetical protein
MSFQKTPQSRQPDDISTLEPLFVSIREAARLMGESVWSTKMRLRAGIYVGRKSGRRTLVAYNSLKKYADGLPAAVYQPPRCRPAPTAPKKPQRSTIPV